MANLTAEQLERLVFALESDNHHDILFALGLKGSNANQKPMPRPKRQSKVKPTPKEASGFWGYIAFCLGLLLILWAASIVVNTPKVPTTKPERVEAARKEGKRT